MVPDTGPSPPGASARYAGAELSRVLAETAAARGMRRLEQLAAQTAAARRSGGEAASTAARSAYAIVELERLMTSDDDGPTDLCHLLNRVGTLLQLSLPSGSELRTSFTTATMPAAAARALVAALLELAHVAADARRLDRPKLFMASFVEGGDLAVAVASGAMAAVPGAAAARCMARARRIAGLLGGAVSRGVGDGGQVLVVVLPVPGMAGVRLS